MSESLSPDNPNEKRREMLNVIYRGIEDRDYEFVTQVANGQTMLWPYELAEWMDVMRRNVEDPVIELRWRSAIRHYLNSLVGIKYPANQTEVLNAILASVSEGASEVDDEQTTGAPGESDWV